MQQDQKWHRAFRVFWRILEFTGLITAIAALGVGVWALIETRKSNELAREAIADSRIAQSWQIVTTRAPGSSGKKQALERLYASGESLQGVDLSCQTMGGWDAEQQDCARRTNLQDLNLAKTEGGARANLRDVNFSYADMTKANLTGAVMEWANLTGAFMEKADLMGTDMWVANLTGAYMRNATLAGAFMWQANLTGAVMIHSNLMDADMWAANLTGADMRRVDLTDVDMVGADLTDADMVEVDLTGADMRYADLTGAVFCDGFWGCAENLSQGQINEAWAWADRPPVFKAGEYALELDMLPLCNPDLREAYEAKQKVGKPWDC